MLFPDVPHTDQPSGDRTPGIASPMLSVDQCSSGPPGAWIGSQASAFSIPYEDCFFDLVFTSGVLIHIAPSDLPRALDEIKRCARTWIWGFEYYAPETTEITYRGHDSLLWKTDFARAYLQKFDDLELFQQERLRYLDNENVDTSFLLRRKA